MVQARTGGSGADEPQCQVAVCPADGFRCAPHARPVPPRDVDRQRLQGEGRHDNVRYVEVAAGNTRQKDVPDNGVDLFAHEEDLVAVRGVRWGNSY